jgi:cell division protein FtsI/penicillin-binding protein 2
MGVGIGRITPYCRAMTLLVMSLVCHRGSAAALDAESNALAKALHGTQAAGIVVDSESGKVLELFGSQQRATPGSAIKPLLLEYALEHGIIAAGTQVFCDRHLRIAGRNVDCTHPADRNTFNAESALAESCNRYFAELGRRFTGAALEQALREARLEHHSVANASGDDRELTALGLENVTVTPRELAEGYRELSLKLPAGGPVERGLRESIDYGMAYPAAVEGMTILGKTGTAKNPGETWTHGWFAGVLPGRMVVVIFVPHGDGGTAAALARQFFLAIRETEARR